MSNSEKVRVFIALDLSKKIIQDLSKIQNNLIKLEPTAKLVNPQNCHLTLAFLGCTSEDKIQTVKEILEQSSVLFSSFILKFNKLNCFPSINRSRIIYWELKKNQQLDLLAHRLRQQLRKSHLWFDQKPSLAHLTIARFRSPRNLTKLIDSISIPKAELKTEKLTLFKSQLTRSGPIYTPLISVNLPNQTGNRIPNCG